MVGDDGADAEESAGIRGTEPGELLHKCLGSAQPALLGEAGVPEFATGTVLELGRDEGGLGVDAAPTLGQCGLQPHERVI